MGTNIYNKEPGLYQCHRLPDFINLVREPKDGSPLPRRKETRVPCLYGPWRCCSSGLELPVTDISRYQSVASERARHTADRGTQRGPERSLDCRLPCPRPRPAQSLSGAPWLLGISLKTLNLNPAQNFPKFGVCHSAAQN